MKKYISMFLVALVGMFTFVSCDPETDEKAGGTAVEKMAGLWVVTVDAVDEDGNVIDENLLGKKSTLIHTIQQLMRLIRCGWMMVAIFIMSR